jgi:anti-sigma factor RsiW
VSSFEQTGHYDQDTLALLALGEATAAKDAGAHLAACDACSAEVAQLSEVVALGRSTSDVTLQEPPASVWAGISTAVATTTIAPVVTAPTTSTVIADPSAAPDNVIPLKKRSRRLATIVGVAAGIAGLIVGAGITVGLMNSSDKGQIVASAPLEGEAVPAAHGTATLTYNSAHQPELQISVVNLPAGDKGYYEVWLMNATPVRFVALGILDNKHSGTFPLPANLPAGKYGYIDVSLQPFNGSPLHSGVSVVRGAIPAKVTKA